MICFTKSKNDNTLIKFLKDNPRKYKYNPSQLLSVQFLTGMKGMYIQNQEIFQEHIRILKYLY